MDQKNTQQSYWIMVLKCAAHATGQRIGFTLDTFIITPLAVAIGAFLRFHVFDFENGWNTLLDLILISLPTFVVLWLIIFAFELCKAPPAIHKQTEARRDAAEVSAAKSRVKQDDVDALSLMRKDGVDKILNCKITNEIELLELDNYWQDWQKKVCELLETSFSISDKIHFDSLGAVKTAVFSHPRYMRHHQILEQWAMEDERLRDIIQRHNPTSNPTV